MKDWVKELEAIMEQLRGEEGCPWDLKQTHHSLKPYLIEEAYEVIEAIDEGNDQKLTSELGDVLLQVVFHSQIAKEEERFNLQDVARSCCEMLIRRHPHIFGEGKLKTPEEVTKQWQAIKEIERQERNEIESSVLDSIPKHLPSLSYAQEIQKKAAKQNFDFPYEEDPMKKIDEEVKEVKDELEKGDTALALEELGDLIFSAVTQIRFLGGDAEVQLRASCNKFKKRFEAVEALIAQTDKKMEDHHWTELLAFWQQVKKK